MRDEPSVPGKVTNPRRLRVLDGAPAGALVVNEVFASIQGESSWAGRPCVFVRTAACHLRCSYCDTRYAFHDGRAVSLDALHAEVAKFGIGLVEVTGGEPLLQPAVLPFMRRLCAAGYEVMLETSGSLDISGVDPHVIRIVDFKAPSSGEVDAVLLSNVEQLGGRDEVKFVIGDRRDYDWARDFLMQHRLNERCCVLMGPVWGQLDAPALAGWIVSDRLPVRLQLQLHKFIWEPNARAV